MRKSILSFAAALLLAAVFLPTTLSAQQNYYTVKFPDDRTIYSCGGKADTVWPQINHLGNCNFSVGVSVKDQVFNLNNNGGCKKIFRTWKLIWWCDYNPNWPAPTIIPNPGDTDTGPTVTANSVNHGYLQYTQVIKIVDNVKPSFLDCPTEPVVFCDYTNDDPAQYGTRCEGPFDLKAKVTDLCSKSDLTISYRLYLDLDGNGSMETYRSSSAADAWPIEKTISADTVSVKIKAPANVGLPYGKHKIEWIANDRCGNEALCKYEFEVKDCKAPTVVCINGLSINMMPTGMITLWASDFLQYTSDNCTPPGQIKIAIRKANTGLGFPLGNNSVTFDCNEVGQQPVEIWAQDAWGNADYCLTYVIVQDNIGACQPSGKVSGSVKTDQGQALAGAQILLKSNLVAVPKQYNGHTDSLGNFNFPAAPGTCNYSIIPTLDVLPALGLSTLDALLAEMHISGQTPLPTPYRIIAADANRDGQVTTADVDAIGNLVVGSATAFPGNSSWRFVPASYVFPNPAKPLSSNFPEKISTTCPVPSGLDQNFIAIKTGDLDGSANLSSKGEDEGAPLSLNISDREFSAGDLVEMDIKASDLSATAGFQFTLRADPNYLLLQSADPGSIAPRLGVSFAENRVALSWHSLTPVAGEQSILKLKFIAQQNGALSQALQMNSDVAHTEAYSRELQKSPLLLQFAAAGERSEASQSMLESTSRALLYPVAPNPSSGPVAAAFFLPQAGTATLSLVDINGKTVYSQSAYFDKGAHRLELPVAGVSGLFFLRLQTAQGGGIQRVVVE